MDDSVNHPAHYSANPSGVECIDITEHMGFNVGNAIKYLWRAGSKGDTVEDLRKAAWYINREIGRIEKFHPAMSGEFVQGVVTRTVAINDPGHNFEPDQAGYECKLCGVALFDHGVTTSSPSGSSAS